MNKIDKWESEIKGLKERIDQDDDEIDNHYGSIKDLYSTVKDMTVDAITTSNAINDIAALNKKIEESEASIKSAEKSIKRREENIRLENKIRANKY